jgi:hypothetical protein
MRSSVITNEESKEHFVENYRFKILSQDKQSADTQEETHNRADRTQEAKMSQNSAQDVAVTLEEAPQIQALQPQPSFVEELLKRVDDMSGSIIKLQMQIENQEAEFARRLDSETARAKEEGVRQGLEEASAKFEEELSGLRNRFLSSVSKLDEEAQKFTDLLTSSETELSNAAVDIAKEVVKKEISAYSSRIAASLCTELLKEIKDAKQISIKVNPKDYEFVSEAFSKSQNIKVSADDAINVGGTIILSDAGNLDGTIEARLEKIKKIVGE